MTPLPGLGSGRTLFVSTFAPTLGSGRALRTWTLVRALASFGPVDMAYVPFGADQPTAAYLDLDGVAFHVIRPSRGVARARTYGTMLLSAVPHSSARAVSPELTRAATRLAGAPGRGLVVAGDFNAMIGLRRLAREMPVAFATQNVESSFGTTDGPVERAALKRTERQLLGLAAESWMVSRRDVELARELAPRSRLRYVPNVVDVASIAPLPRPADGATVLLLGDFSYAPNRDGACWLVNEVLPLVAQRVPAVRVRLAGHQAEQVVAPNPRVEVAGFVEHLRDAYAGCSAVAVPLLESGGTPMKFVEALAFGIPVVSTPVAAQGLAVEPGEHFRLAPGGDLSAFADHVASLLIDGDEAMARRARLLVEQRYSVQTLERLLAH